jgi:hypothetical protein
MAMGHSDHVQTVGLSWEHSFELAAALAASGAGMALARHEKIRAAGAFAREIAVIGFLYGLWQLAGRLSLGGTSGAIGRAHWVERVEHDVRLPSEASVQHLVLGQRLVIEGANLYYATMHFTMMFVFLLWLFVRHRDRYRPIRQVLAWTTLGCLLVQLIPVAPPRMLAGIVDTGLVYHQSVYSGGLEVDQLSAMPSVHVAWAVLVGYYAWRVSPSRWRYVAVLHTALTAFVVVVTGNHFWLDGIVAVALLALSGWGVSGVRAGWSALLAQRTRSTADGVTLHPARVGGTAQPSGAGIAADGAHATQ